MGVGEDGSFIIFVQTFLSVRRGTVLIRENGQHKREDMGMFCIFWWLLLLSSVCVAVYA